MLVDKTGTHIITHHGNSVSGIKPEELEAMLHHLDGLVRGYVIGRKGVVFTIRDILGGDNFVWTGTPLQRLYEIYDEAGYSEEDCIKCAGQAAGRLLKRVIIEIDGMTFELHEAVDGRVNGYAWRGDHN